MATACHLITDPQERSIRMSSRSRSMLATTRCTSAAHDSVARDAFAGGERAIPPPSAVPALWSVRVSRELPADVSDTRGARSRRSSLELRSGLAIASSSRSRPARLRRASIPKTISLASARCSGNMAHRTDEVGSSRLICWPAGRRQAPRLRTSMRMASRRSRRATCCRCEGFCRSPCGEKEWRRAKVRRHHHRPRQHRRS